MREAEEGYKRAISLTTRRADIRHHLGNLYVRQNRYNDAVREYEEAVRIGALHYLPC
jgi:Tfp pilus assembly protein PilF